MIGSINGYEWLVLVVVALVLIGPERLPSYAAQLGRVVRELRRMAQGASERVREEMGEDLEGLTAFDPRQYDPRRIIRDALADPTTAQPQPRAQHQPQHQAQRGGTAVPRAPFDDEAT